LIDDAPAGDRQRRAHLVVVLAGASLKAAAIFDVQGGLALSTRSLGSTC
jgi:hypothetical protein